MRSLFQQPRIFHSSLALCFSRFLSARLLTDDAFPRIAIHAFSDLSAVYRAAVINIPLEMASRDSPTYLKANNNCRQIRASRAIESRDFSCSRTRRSTLNFPLSCLSTVVSRRTEVINVANAVHETVGLYLLFISVESSARFYKKARA